MSVLEPELYSLLANSFVTVDPLASSMPNMSSYAYVFNNPVSFTDPTGMVGECLICVGSDGNTQGAGSASSNEGYQNMKEANHREMADAAARSRIQSWIKNIDIHNPFGGDEIYRSISDSQVDIVYAGAKQRASSEQVQNLASILYRSYSGTGLVALAFGITGEIHHSSKLGLWFAQNGKGFQSVAFAGNQYFARVHGWSSQAVTASTSIRYGRAARGLGYVGVGLSTINYLANDRSVPGLLAPISEYGMARLASRVGGPAGLALSAGWEGGRFITTLNGYQKWKHETWMPYRLKKFHY